MRRAPADRAVRRTKQNYTDRDPQSRSGSIFFALLRKSPHLPLTALLRGNVSPMLDASTNIYLVGQRICFTSSLNCAIISPVLGALAQLVECHTGSVDVSGSSPLCSTTK